MKLCGRCLLVVRPSSSVILRMFWWGLMHSRSSWKASDEADCSNWIAFASDSKNAILSLTLPTLAKCKGRFCSRFLGLSEDTAADVSCPLAFCLEILGHKTVEPSIFSTFFPLHCFPAIPWAAAGLIHIEQVVWESTDKGCVLYSGFGQGW